MNDSGAGVLSSRTERLLCSCSWFINIPFPLPSAGAQTLVWFCVIPRCVPTGQLSSDERLIRSMLSCPLLLQSLSDLRKSVHPVYSLTVRVGHLGFPFKQQQVLSWRTSHQQHEQLQQGKWKKTYSPEAHKESTGVAHTRPFGSESLGKGRYFWNTCTGPPRSFISNYEDKRPHICSHSVSCGF